MIKLEKWLRRLWWRNRLSAFGRNSLIWPGTRINCPGTVSIGEDTVLYHECFIANTTDGPVRIGSRSHLGVRVYCNCAGAALTIGDDTAIAPYTQIYTYSNHYAAGRLSREVRKTAPVSIGNNVLIGSGSVILPGVIVGDHAVIGAGSVVRGEVPAGAIVAGVPARQVGIAQR